MAITIHQSAGVIGAENDNSPDASFSTTPTTGRYVVVCAICYAGIQDLGAISCADNQSNSYGSAQYTYTESTKHKQVYFVAPITTSSGTFTVTVSIAGMESWAASNVWFSISEVSGLDSTDYVDQTGSGSGESTSASVALATMEADTMVFAQCWQAWDVSMTRAAGWTAVYEPANTYGVIQRTGDYDPSWTLGLSNPWKASAVGFNAGATGRTTKNVRAFPHGIFRGIRRMMSG